MYDAAATEESQKLAEYRSHHSRAVRFGAFCNPLTVISTSDLGLDSIFKFAAIANPSTPTEVLDAIGLNQANLNPIFPISINKHKNVSKEYQVYFNLAGLETDPVWILFSNLYFKDSIYEEGRLREGIDVESIQALFYLYILGFIKAPNKEEGFWIEFVEHAPQDIFQSTIEMFGLLPATPETLNRECQGIVGVRSIAAEHTENHELMNKLSWDRNSGSISWEEWWEERRKDWEEFRNKRDFDILRLLSPRSGVANNDNAPASLLTRIFHEEVQDAKALSDDLCPVLWTLSSNPTTTEDVLSEIVSLIETNRISDKFAQIRLLVGEPDVFAYGLITNRSVQGDLRNRVEALIRERDLDPTEYGVI